MTEPITHQLGSEIRKLREACRLMAIADEAPYLEVARDEMWEPERYRRVWVSPKPEAGSE